MAAALTVALFSLAGLPFFAGFTTKFYLFTAAAAGGYLWLAGLAATASLISLYYYLMVIKQMYIHPPDDATPLATPLLTKGVLAVLVLAIIFIGVYPGPLVDAIAAASRAHPPRCGAGGRRPVSAGLSGRTNGPLEGTPSAAEKGSRNAPTFPPM